jgi:hypothetical protein
MPPPHSGRNSLSVFTWLNSAAFGALLSLFLIFAACENFGIGDTATSVPENLVSIGGTEYATLEEAIQKAAGTTAVITVKYDIAVSKTISVVTENTNITLKTDGAAWNITNTGKDASLFTLEGSGNVLTLESGITLNKGGVTVKKGAELVFKDGAKITGASGDGGVWVYAGGTFTMEGGVIQGNAAAATRTGGGVYTSGTFTMKGGVIQSNKALEGGGVYIDKTGTFTMEDGNIQGNNSDIGGGVYVCAGGIFTMEDGNIQSNTAPEGGGVKNDGSFTIKGGNIQGNTASRGGGVKNDGSFTMEDGNIQGNTALEGGGVYLVSSSAIEKTGGNIYGSNAASADQNKATEKGAAVYVDSLEVSLGKTVDADHKLIKEVDNATTDSLTADNGWTDDWSSAETEG